MNPQKLIPSMFHRRLVLLSSGLLVITAALGAQMVRLSVVEGEARRAETEARLADRRFLPTYRGRILDRHGRVLARDRASHDIAVRYDVITGEWAYDQAQRQARREVGGGRWGELNPVERGEEVLKRLPEWDARIQPVWEAIMRLGHLSRAQLDERLDEIKREVQAIAVRVWDRRATQQQKRYADMTEEEARESARIDITEQRQAHVILPRVSEEAAFEFQQLAQQLPPDKRGPLVEAQMSTQREYPLSSLRVTLSRAGLPREVAIGGGAGPEASPIDLEGVADHLLGSMRDEVWAEDIERRPFQSRRGQVLDLGGYRTGDAVGARGLELVHEDRLRGSRGMVVRRRDTDEETRTEMIPGADLRTTIDVALQARVQAILSPSFGLAVVQQWQSGWAGGAPVPTGLPLGTPLNSATVVMEVTSGEILAMVSMPTIAMGEKAVAEGRSGADYIVNRPAEAIYPPGSIIKPFVLSAAVMEKVHNLESSVECTGHYFPERNDVARCWIYRDRYGFQTHGQLGAEEALARSCNIFFYTLADRLGMRRLGQWYRRFGLGAPLDVGLLYEASRRVLDSEGKPTLDESGKPKSTRVTMGEAAGQVPDESDIEALRKRGELAFASVIFGTGQGPVAWTPLQAANAYATLARGGAVRDATLIADDSGRARLVPPRASMSLPPALVASALEGLRRSVEEKYGTGHHISYADNSTEPVINAPGVTVWAKTGTAQASTLVVDRDADGKADERISNLSHAWFVGLVGDARSGANPQPRFVIAVIVEYGGSGGKVSGPIANQIIRALQDEGYLSRPQPRAEDPNLESAVPRGDVS